MIAVPIRSFWPVLLLSLLLAGCAASGGGPESPPLPDPERIDYRIGIGDTLTVHVWRNAELTQNVVVRPDGQVSMPLMGDLQAEGQRPEQLAETITRALASVIRNPEVTVIVNASGNAEYQRRVRVVGQVNQPMSLVYKEGMTVVDLVLAAGGLTEFAAGDRATLHRQVEGEYQAFPLRLQAVLDGGDVRTNYPLLPTDYISVPEKQLWRGEF